ncbi:MULTISPECIES: hypothetical protein [Moorena]|uniref:Uncharacterized protein n=1 Tax=Moorena producens (strain JHB) TaxID=1454205 RepID=A0A9Q9SU39_MOOP1|nr:MULTISPECIES: hypothetical protein [Moorena]WAN69656.1 hypothetical protein BJP36_36805 [Moorena producens JHB]
MRYTIFFYVAFCLLPLASCLLPKIKNVPHQVHVGWAVDQTD